MAYDADPSLNDVPMNLSDLEEIAARGGKDLNNSRRLAHFLRRVVATVRSKNESIRQLNKDINQMRAQSESIGRPTTLHPMDVLKYLSDEQRAQVASAEVQAQLRALHEQQAQAQEAHRRYNQLAGRIRFALVTLVEDPALPADARVQLQQMLSQVDDSGRGSQSAPTGSGFGAHDDACVERGPKEPPSGGSPELFAAPELPSDSDMPGRLSDTGT